MHANPCIAHSMEIIPASEVVESLGLPLMREMSTFGALSDGIILDLLRGGRIEHLQKGDYIARYGEKAEDFQVVLQGKIAYYKHCEDLDVLTRYFSRGEQIGFDEMIGLISRDGTDVAVEDSLILNISSDQFYRVHVKYPAEFGVFMLNLARELSREIAILEDVISRGTGWQPEQNR